MRSVYFVTHPEVIIDPQTPVQNWSLSELGLQRMRSLLKQSWVGDITSIYCSTEKKAIDGANMLAEYCALPIQQVHELAENDRSSTGYLPSAEFESMANKFFASPFDSIDGWESAISAQARIVNAVQKIAAEDVSAGSIAIVSHGAVGALLLCELAGYSIDRQYDQPGSGGGNYYVFDLQSMQLQHEWIPIDQQNQTEK